MAKRVLITDDALFMRTTLKSILTKNGFTVVGEAINGRESIDLYMQTQPDVVMMDITMPDMDGITAVNEIKRIDATAKIIMCSAMGQKDMVLKAVAAGAKGFIVKPFQAEKVIETLQKLVA
jgi:two-component system chemotaxis response regulator CheY